MSGRLDKVNALVGAEVSRALSTVRFEGALPTVTGVETTSDLANADVWISLLPDDDAAWEAVEEQAPAIQQALAARLTLKRTPRLRFRRDRSGRSAQRIDELLGGGS